MMLTPGMGSQADCSAAVPWDCSFGWVPLIGAPIAFSTRCREAYDLKKACESGYYPEPSRPAAPTVPPGGYTGAVTDPYAVDVVIADTKARQDAQSIDFFSRSDIAAPVAEDRTNAYVLYAFLGVFLLMAIKR